MNTERIVSLTALWLVFIALLTRFDVPVTWLFAAALVGWIVFAWTQLPPLQRAVLLLSSALLIPTYTSLGFPLLAGQPILLRLLVVLGGLLLALLALLIGLDRVTRHRAGSHENKPEQ